MFRTLDLANIVIKMEADKIDPYHLYMEEEMCKCMILQFVANITFSN